jgi:hypothetical protein
LRATRVACLAIGGAIWLASCGGEFSSSDPGSGGGGSGGVAGGGPGSGGAVGDADGTGGGWGGGAGASAFDGGDEAGSIGDAAPESSGGGGTVGTIDGSADAGGGGAGGSPDAGGDGSTDAGGGECASKLMDTCVRCCNQKYPAGMKTYAVRMYDCACSECAVYCAPVICDTGTRVPNATCLSCLNYYKNSGVCPQNNLDCSTDANCTSYRHCVEGCL